MKLFHQTEIIPEPNDHVELTIFEPTIGYFAITGSFQDVEPSYEQILQEQAAGERKMRHTGKFALAGF